MCASSTLLCSIVGNLGGTVLRCRLILCYKLRLSLVSGWDVSDKNVGWLANNTNLGIVFSIGFCSFTAPFLPRLGLEEDAVSDFRLVPVADLGEELFWDVGLEFCAAILDDCLVLTIVKKFRQRQRYQEDV